MASESVLSASWGWAADAGKFACREACIVVGDLEVCLESSALMSIISLRWSRMVFSFSKRRS